MVVRNLFVFFGLLASWVAPMQSALASGGMSASEGGEHASSSHSVEVNGRGRLASLHLHESREVAPYLVNSIDDELGPNAGRRQMMRSELEAGLLEETPQQGVEQLENEEADGLTANACKNFDKTGRHKAEVSCPAPLKMAGCSCRDKIPEKTGACSAAFLKGETCGAYTVPEANITAYVRCCNFKHSDNWTIETSDPSGPNDGDGASINCPETHTLIGCGCQTVDGQAGCKMSRVNNLTCEATNNNNPLRPHTAGVKAQALCAVVEGSKDWESPALHEHTQEPKNMSTGLKCSQEDNEMISCSCASSSGECSGGKVLGNKCECWGFRCFASARCAKIPIPPVDCKWSDWGEWGDCSTSCGAGTKSRVREIAVMAEWGGKDCKGPTHHVFDCEADATEMECALKNRKAKKYEKNNTLTIIVVVVCVCLVILLGCAFAIHHHYAKKKLEKEQGLYGEGEGEYAEQLQFDGEQPGQDTNEEATVEETPAETVKETAPAS